MPSPLPPSSSTIASSSADGVLPDARPPVEGEGVRASKLPSAAAGMTAAVSALGMGVREMGVARTAKLLLKVNQEDGFDCQSCAWPNPEDRHVAEFCENGARAVADEGTRKRVDPSFFEEHSNVWLAQQSDHWLGKQGRLTQPMVLREGSDHYEPIAWDEAFALIGAELKGLDHPDEAVFYTSGRTSNEAAFLYQLFVRMYGTNNLPDCSNMCHESSGTAMNEVIGVGKGTVTLEDFDHAEAIFVIGQNPGTNHPRMLSALQSAKRRGCKIVSINPLPEVGTTRFKNPQEVWRMFGGGTRLADLFLQVRIGGDMALLKGIMKAMLADDREKGDVFDHAFIQANTHGFEDLVAALDRTPWDVIEHESGIQRSEIDKAKDIAASSKSIICCWAMGLTQHPRAVATIQEVINLLLLRGSIGRKGAGACPVRGHSNVQGDRTMGIWERPPLAFLQRLGDRFAFQPPSHHGMDVVMAIEAMAIGKAKVFVAMGGNFLSATPDTEYTAEALRRCSLTVQVSTKLNRAHLVTGRRALILPCLGRSEIDVQAEGEQFVTVEDSMGIVSRSRGPNAPASPDLKSEVAIVAGIAKASLAATPDLDWDHVIAHYDRIRDHIEAVIPGFADYNARVQKGPFHLPNAAREGQFRTATGKAMFTAHDLTRAEELQKSLPSGHLTMMTIRSHDQFNTTIYGLDDRYRGIFGGRRVILMNREDMGERGLAEFDLVDLTSHFEGQLRQAPRFRVVPFDIPRGSCATYFPEANVLVPIGSVAERSNTPTSKYVVITVAKSAPS